jgi:tetratricopeptide (TPR) repeat protein
MKYFLISLIILSFSFGTSKEIKRAYDAYYNGDYKTAIKLYSNEVDTISLTERSDIYFWIGKSYQCLNDKTNAKENFNKSLKLNKRNKKTKEAIKQLKMDMSFSKEAEKYYNNGYMFFKKKQYKKAIKYYKKAVAINPTIPKYQLWLGRSMGRARYLSKGKAHIELASFLDPNNKDAKILLSEDLKKFKTDRRYSRDVLKQYKAFVKKQKEVKIVKEKVQKEEDKEVILPELTKAEKVIEHPPEDIEQTQQNNSIDLEDKVISHSLPTIDLKDTSYRVSSPVTVF